MAGGVISSCWRCEKVRDTRNGLRLQPWRVYLGVLDLPTLYRAPEMKIAELGSQPVEEAYVDCQLMLLCASEDMASRESDPMTFNPRVKRKAVGTWWAEQRWL